MNFNNRSKKPNYKKRVNSVYAIIVIMALVFVGRLLSLQIFGGDEYKQKALEQRKSIVEIAPTRGKIYDSNMNPLAISVKINTLFILPKEIENKQSASAFLAEVLDKRQEDLLRLMEGEEMVRVENKLSNEQTDKIKAAKIRGVSIAPETSRFYPAGEFAPYVLGFLDHQNHGSYGVERSYDSELYGKSGLNIASVSPFGDIIPYEDFEKHNAKEGSDIVLTIDDRIQELATRFAKETYEKYRPKKLTILVMNPKDGDVLALENLPKYDPNNPRKARSSEEENNWKEYSEEELLQTYFNIWRSFAVNDIYEPGSVFKFITAAAAVEEGTATDDSVYHCNGVVTDIPGVVLKCYRWYDPHGDQNLVEAMDHSCNPAFIQMVRELGHEKMYKYIRDFGFGKPTGIRLPAEAEGIIPEAANAINLPQLATMSYGHGIAVTPIQMISAISAVVNGGKLYTPRIVKEIIDVNTQEKLIVPHQFKRQVISEKTSEKMRYMMEHGVEHGTADGAKIPGYKIGGKTGTSVKFVDGKYENETTVASYIGVFPAEDPEFIVLAVVDEPHGASSSNVVSAPLVRNIIKGIIDLKGYLPTEPIEEHTDGNVEIPYVVGLPLSRAVQVLKDLGFQHFVVNPNMNKESLVSSQAPEAGESLPYGSIVDLMSDETGLQWIQMPNLVGMEVSEAKILLDRLGIKYAGVETEGVIQTQSPKEGTLVDPESTVEFSTASNGEDTEPKVESNSHENNVQEENSGE